MAKQIFKRFISLLVIVWIVSVIAFVLMRLAPGDPAMMALPDYASEEEIATMRTKLGLDEPYIVQYWMFLSGILKGDFGTSVLYQRPCLDIIMERMPATINLSLVSALFTIAVSVPLGIIAGAHKGSLIDVFAVFFSLIGQSMSVVWICVVLLLICTVYNNWLPSMGYNGLFDIKYLIMPAIANGYKLCAGLVRMGRSGMIDVLNEDYITCARARGIPEYKVNLKYAFKNAMLPVMTLFGLDFAIMLAGAVVIESTFTIPGIGNLLVKAVQNRDYPLTQSLLIISAAIFALVNIVVDIINSLLDRRIKFN